MPALHVPSSLDSGFGNGTFLERVLQRGLLREGLVQALAFRFLKLLHFTLVTGPRRSLNLKLSDTRVYEPQIRARLGTTAHEVVLNPET